MSFRNKSGSFLDLVVEVILIGLGVFLALLANNWHEAREHRALAESTLRNFAEELRTNQHHVEQERTYHETLAAELQKFLASTGERTQEQFEQSVHLTGVHPIIFEHTAWDLALATQALSYLKPDVALAVSKVYTQQNSFQTLENNFSAAAYTTLANPDVAGLAKALQIYLGDVNVQEPQLLALYDKVLPQIGGKERLIVQ